MQDTKMDKLLASLSCEEVEQSLNSAMQSLLLNGTAWLKMSWNDTEQKLQLQRIGIQGPPGLRVIYNTLKKLDE